MNSMQFTFADDKVVDAVLKLIPTPMIKIIRSEFLDYQLCSAYEIFCLKVSQEKIRRDSPVTQPVCECWVCVYELLEINTQFTVTSWVVHSTEHFIICDSTIKMVQIWVRSLKWTFCSFLKDGYSFSSSVVQIFFFIYLFIYLFIYFYHLFIYLFFFKSDFQFWRNNNFIMS